MVDISGSYGKLRRWVARQIDAIKLENLADVDKSAQGDNKVLVYKTASNNHVYEPPSSGGTAGRGISVYRMASQTILNITFTTILFDTVTFDANNEYNPATGRFTPQVAGYYICCASLSLKLLGDGKKYIYTLRKNGTIVQGVDRSVVGGTDFVGACVSSVIYLNGSTDYVTAVFYHNHGSSRVTHNVQGYVQLSAWILPAPAP